MQRTGDILAKNSRYQKFLELGRKVREWYKKNGNIGTNFGWLHKEWIDQGFKMGAIVFDVRTSTKDFKIYKILADEKTTTNIDRSQGRPRSKEKTTPDVSQWEKWLKFIQTKREVPLLPEELAKEAFETIYEEGK